MKRTEKEWNDLLKSRIDRMHRLIDIKAPEMILAREGWMIGNAYYRSSFKMVMRMIWEKISGNFKSFFYDITHKKEIQMFTTDERNN